MSKRTHIAAIILAAGQASRFRAADPAATTKTVALLDGQPLVRRVAEAARGAALSPVIVVTGFARAEVEDALNGLPVRFVHNPDYATGLASSLKAGVAALDQTSDGAAILLADMPRVSAQLISQLADILVENPEAAAVAPTWNGTRGNPVILSRDLFSAVAGLEGDVGARPLLAGRTDVIDAPVDDAAVTLDVDTPEALRRLEP